MSNIGYERLCFNFFTGNGLEGGEGKRFIFILMRDYKLKYGRGFMDAVFYAVEKGEKWLTPFEKRQWREKYRALYTWCQNKGIEISPWLQVRLRELLIVTFFIQRLEAELLLSNLNQKTENAKESRESLNRTEKTVSNLSHYEVLCKYLERQRKLVQELEELKPAEVKTSTISIAELVQDLIVSARELDKGNGKLHNDIAVDKEKLDVLGNDGI